MHALTTYDFNGATVRTVSRNGDPWWVAADVCDILELGNSRQALARLDDDEKGVTTVDTPGGSQSAAIINESGLYSLTLTSRKPQAKAFKKWITSEVIPSIRKTGGYGQPADPSALLKDPVALRQMLLEHNETVLALEAKVAAQAPTVAAFERIADQDGSYNITETAKMLQVPPKALFRHLRANGWIYKRAGAGSDIGYQDKINAGLLMHKATTIERADGTEKSVVHVRVTPKGLTKLARDLSPDLFN